MLHRIINKLKRIYYKRLLEKAVGRKLPSVVVMGEINISNVSIECGENVVFYPRVTFSGNGRIVIGDNCKIGQDSIIYANKDNGGVTIGVNTIIAAQTYIIDSNHRMYLGDNVSNQGLDFSPIFIGSDVWIAANCTILKGSIIKDGAVIGAKSLVNSMIEKNSIAYGIPAKSHGQRRGKNE